MSRLEALDGESWRDLLAAPTAVLVLGRSGCAACTLWLEELEAFLAADEAWTRVRFGWLLLDQPGLVGFKRANPWVAEVCELPTNRLCVEGEVRRTWLGGGVRRLEERLALLDGDGP